MRVLLKIPHWRKKLAAIRRCNESKDRDWYTITDKTKRVIGETGLLRMFPEWCCTDLTIIIPNPEDQGRGYGTEAIKLMFDLAFNQLNFNRISIGVVGFNTKRAQVFMRKQASNGKVFRNRDISITMSSVILL